MKADTLGSETVPSFRNSYASHTSRTSCLGRQEARSRVKPVRMSFPPCLVLNFPAAGCGQVFYGTGGIFWVGTKIAIRYQASTTMYHHRCYIAWKSSHISGTCQKPVRNQSETSQKPVRNPPMFMIRKCRTNPIFIHGIFLDFPVSWLRCVNNKHSQPAKV